MLASGTNVTLRPYKTYKNNPENNVAVGYGENKRGKFLKFQVMDVNNSGSKKATGFLYVNVHTDLPLKVFDMVTIDQILYVQRKFNVVVIGITIKQTNPEVLEMPKEDIFEGIDF